MSARVLSLCWLTVRGAHPLEHIEAARAGGFNAIGLRLVPPAPGDPMVPVVGDEPLVREIAARTRDTGVEVLDVEAVWLTPQTDVAALRPVLETARRLRCTNLLTMGNDPDAQRLADTFGRLCDEAAAFGIDVSMEFAAFTQVRTIAAAQALVASVGRANAKVLVDTLHLARSGGTPADVQALPASRLAYVQLADARGPGPNGPDALRAEARGARFQPGEGELPLAELLEVLPAGLPLGIETPGAALEGRDVVEQGRIAGAALRKFLADHAR